MPETASLRKLSKFVLSAIFPALAFLVVWYFFGRPIKRHASASEAPIESLRAEIAKKFDISPARTPTQPSVIQNNLKTLPESEQASLQEAFSMARRGIYPLSEHERMLSGNEGANYMASNPGQKLQARFLDHGVRLLSGNPGRDWQGVLSLNSLETAGVSHEGTRMEYFHDHVTEWYENRPEGIEHGFTIQQPEVLSRAAGDAVMRLEVRVDGLSVEALAGRDEGSSDLQFVDEAGTPVIAYSGLKVWDSTGESLEASMEPTEAGFEILVSTRGASFPITVDPLITSLETQLSNEKEGYGSSGDFFGFSVSISDYTALVGAPSSGPNGNFSGSAFVFVRSGSVWSLEQRIVPDDGASRDFFGYSISLDGDSAAIGTIGDETFTGSAYVYVRNAGVWTQQQKLTPGDGFPGMYYGYSISIDADSVLIGAYGDNDPGMNAGSAYVYTRSGGTWSLEQKIVADDGAGQDRFGYAVSLSGDRALVGAYGDDGSGSAYVFIRDTGVWSQEQKLTASDGADGDKFGLSVSMDGDTALIGAPEDDDAGNKSGSAYLFAYQDGTWTEVMKLVAADGGENDEFGFSVSIDADTAVIGAHRDDGVGQFDHSAGSAYVYVRGEGNWVFEEKLTASNGMGVDEFGFAVDVDADTVIAGAWMQDVYGSNSGGAYIFIRDNGGWFEEENLTAGDSADGDLVGMAVSLYGDTALIGASEDGNTGAAYVFVRDGSTWSLEQKLTADDAEALDVFGYSVSLDQNIAVISAPGHDDEGSSSGCAYIFVRDGNNWSQQQKITAGDEAGSIGFGTSVSLSGDTVLIGSPSENVSANNSGSARIYDRIGGEWILKQKLTASDGAVSDYFGNSVSLEGDTAVIGAYGDEAYTGSAYVFVRNHVSWSERQKLTAPDGGGTDSFGYSVSLSGDTLAIGAPEAEVEGAIYGAVYMFVRESKAWGLEQKILPSDGPGYKGFGDVVSLDGDTVLVGAPADGADEEMESRGSAYVYVRRYSTWIRETKIIPADGATGDGFGSAVSLEGDTALIGAPSHDGIDMEGGPTTNQGSAYVYRIDFTLPDTDGDIVSDLWETDNGFDITIPNDHLTLDSDGDGDPDILEIYQGTDRNNAEDYFGIFNLSVDAPDQQISFRIVRSNDQLAVLGTLMWSQDLVHWHESGETENGVTVLLDETLLFTYSGLEFYEIAVEATGGVVDQIFFQFVLRPID